MAIVVLIDEISFERDKEETEDVVGLMSTLLGMEEGEGICESGLFVLEGNINGSTIWEDKSSQYSCDASLVEGASEYSCGRNEAITRLTNFFAVV